MNTLTLIQFAPRPIPLYSLETLVTLLTDIFHALMTLPKTAQYHHFSRNNRSDRNHHRTFINSAPHFLQ